MKLDKRTRAAAKLAEDRREIVGIQGLTIDEALELFNRSPYLPLARRLKEQLLDSVSKKLDEKRDPRTRRTHDARVKAFLEGSRVRFNEPAQAMMFATAFPKEAKELHLFTAARHLCRLMRQEAQRLQLPLLGARSPPTAEQLQAILTAVSIPKASAERTYGHPMLRQLIQVHGWSNTDLQAALRRKGYTDDQAETIVRDSMRPRRGAKKSHSGTVG